MNSSESRRGLLSKARADIAQFPAENWEQQKLQALLLTMLGYMDRVLSRPEHRHELPRWWRVVDTYWRALESAELASKERRAFLAELLGDQDEIHDHPTEEERSRCEACIAADLAAQQENENHV